MKQDPPVERREGKGRAEYAGTQQMSDGKPASISEGRGAPEVHLMDYLIQDDVRRALNEIHAVCEPTLDELSHSIVETDYFGENAQEMLDPEAVLQGERPELERLLKMSVCECVATGAATNDPEGKLAKVNWVRINKGTEDNPDVR